MYIIHDYSNLIGTSMSWLNSEGSATIFSPSGGGSTVVPFNDDKRDGKRVFIVGCFGSAGYSEFSVIGKTAFQVTLADC